MTDSSRFHLNSMPKPYIPNDAWSRKAAAEGYRARSVYKLQELDGRNRLLKQGMKVIDIGAAPGSWLQYASKKVGRTGKIVGFDLQEIEPVADNVALYVLDVNDRAAMEEILRKEGAELVDLVLSDIAPATSGVKDVDQWRSVELAQAVFALASDRLKPGGRCVVKVFRGADFDAFLGELRTTWKNVRVAHVQATRDRSKEVYVIATKESINGQWTADNDGDDSR